MSNNQKYILGLDLGVKSVGWAIIPLNAKKGPNLRLGVRCFDSGTGTEQEIEQGKDESRNSKRRDARSVRRNQWRRKRRTLKLFNLLRNNGLLPMGKGPGDTPEDRQELINELDAKLFKKIHLKGDRVAAHLLPYQLRAMALDKKLEPFALGRAFLHLSQRRGFLSNKKTADKEEDEGKGTVKPAITELEMEIEEKGFRTLGEFFASLDPEEKRIRQRWTGRKMFEKEFNAICDFQEKKHPGLLDRKVVLESWRARAKKRKGKRDDESLKTKEMTLREAIHHILFFQRPLKSQKHLIGKCELERGKRRAPLASMEAQRFRYWQRILDLEYRNDDGFMVSLSPDQQDALAKELEDKEKLTYAQMRTFLEFKQPRLSKVDKENRIKPKYVFNFEQDYDDADKGLKGNTTSARIMKIIPQRWTAMPDYERESLINEILQFEREDALAKRLEKVFGFDSSTASQLAAVQLERDHAKLSRQAIRKILPVMLEKRIPFMTARKEIYGEPFDEERKETLDFLPPVLQAVKDLKNPIVTRTLTEVRKVVNAIIRKYGKPETIRIELARDMKKSRSEREKLSKEMRQQEKRREEARKKILSETGNREPRPTEIQKILLAEECNWQCPYTGKQITVSNLLGPNPQFDIEHTLPFSRSLDNSFANKSLCDIHENRHIKKNQTPFEAYGKDPQRWHDILSRVQTFRGPAAETKLRRFQMEEIPEDFTSRMLNDTRYISRLAGDYLGLLYGGRSDEKGKLRIQASSGGMTAWLRDEWKMNDILGDGNEKNRTDHRHHAIDAAVIAMCDPGTVKNLSRAAEKASEQGLHRRFAKDTIEEPVPNFKQLISEAKDKINISFRANRKVSGGFHDETNYSPPQYLIEGEGKKAKKVEYRHVRKPLANMSTKEIEQIVDPTIRQLVQERLQKLGSDPKAFANESELPYIRAKDGRVIPIRKARYRKTVAVLSLGKNEKTQRHVAPGNNHHMEIVAHLDDAGNETKWEGVIVSMYEAYQRRRRGEKIVCRDHGPGKRFKFSFVNGEFIERLENDGTWMLWRIVCLSGKEVRLTFHQDARPSGETIRVPGSRPSVGTLMGKVRKVHVDVLGNIHPSND